MGTTENTAGPPLLIYRYAYSASRTGPIFPSNVTHAPGGVSAHKQAKFFVCTNARKLTPDARGEMFVQLFFSREIGVIS